MGTGVTKNYKGSGTVLLRSQRTCWLLYEATSGSLTNLPCFKPCCPFPVSAIISGTECPLWERGFSDLP